MAPMFSIGEVVVCIDASDLPYNFVPLHAGSQYIIRTVDPIVGDEAYDGNIHKRAKYCVRLFGVINSKLTNGVERAYMETRFEKIGNDGAHTKAKLEKKIKA